MIDRHLYTPNGDNPPCAVPLNDLCTVPTEQVACLLADLVIGDRNAKELDLLEIGTGSGYQAAILAERCRSLVSIEVNLDPSVAYKLPDNMAVIHANGYEYDTAEQFDGVLITFASVAIAPIWAEQLKEGGRLVVPLTRSGISQVRVYERMAFSLVLKDVVGYAAFTEGIPV